MNIAIYILIGLVVGGVAGYFIGKRKQGSYMEAREEFDALNERRAEERQKHLDQILAIFNPGDEITNDKVEHLLHISDLTPHTGYEPLKS
jgi:hypothetical protein